jgi:hypothetical protein
MIAVDIQVSGLDEVKSMLGDLSGQMPFTISTAINWTLNDIQGAVRSHVHDEFTVRSPEYIDRSIYIGSADRAKKDDLTGTVRVNPDRNQLAKFEDDSTKTPQTAANLAIPVFKEQTGGAIITRGDPLSLKSLMAAINRNGKNAGKFKGQKGGKIKDATRTAYLVKNAKGTFIVGRSGTETRVLYAFKPAASITSHRLEFDEIAERTALAMWEENCTRAINLALETAR